MNFFSIEDDGLLENYNDIWNKVSTSIKKEPGCDPIYNNKFLKRDVMW